jgi:hypothetical protein
LKRQREAAAKTAQPFLPSREFWMVDAVECRLLAIGHRHLMTDHINRFKPKKLSFRLRNDLNPRVPNVAFPKTFRGDHANYVAMLGRWSVMHSYATETAIVAIRNMTGTGQ